MSKIKEFCQKHREILAYLFFGVITMMVSFCVFYATIYVSNHFFGALEEGKDSARYLAWNVFANILKWCSGVLVAFYTNRKWVFTEADKSKNVFLQLLAFSGGRVLTFVLDYFITFFGGLLLSRLLPPLNNLMLLGFTFNFNEVSAKIVAAVVVIIGNYIFSKLLVFRKK